MARPASAVSDKSPAAASAPSAAALIPLGSHAKAAPIELKRPATLIGARKEIVRLHLQSSTVSKAHCVVVLNHWGCYVHDLASRTGVLVNDKLVMDADLVDGDVLQVGRFRFQYRAPRPVHGTPMPAGTADVSVSTLSGPLAVTKRVLTIGRRPGCDVLFEDPRVGNVHAIVFEQNGRRFVRDLSSRTGTWLGAKPVHQEPLPDVAPLRIGGAVLSFLARPAEMPAADDAPLTLADAARGRGGVVTVPGSGGPDVRAAEMAAADFAVLDVEAPDLEVPDAKALDVKTFDVKTFDVKALDVKAFDVEAIAGTHAEAATVDPVVAETPAIVPAVPADAAPPAFDPAAGLEPLELDLDADLVADLDDDVNDVAVDPADGLASLRRDWLATPRPPAEPAPSARPTTPPVPAPLPPPAPIDEVVESDAGAETEVDSEAEVAADALLALDDADVAGPVVADAAPPRTAPAEDAAADGDADARIKPLPDVEIEAETGQTVGQAVPADLGTTAKADADAEAATRELVGLDGAIPAGPVGPDAVLADAVAEALPADADAEPDAEPTAAVPAAGPVDAADAEVAFADDLDATDDELFAAPSADQPIDATLADLIAVGLIADPDAPAGPESTAPGDAGPAVVGASDALGGPDLSDLDALDESTSVAATTAAGDALGLGLGLVVGDLVDFGDLRLETADDELAPPADLVARAPAARPEAEPDPVVETADAAAPELEVAEAISAARVAMPSLADDDLDADRDLDRDTDADIGLDGGAFARRPGQTPVEPDLVRLDLDEDDEANEATALAVDLGLVLDDEADAPEIVAGPAAGPARPVEIDLASAPAARDPAAPAGYGAPAAPAVPPAGITGLTPPADPAEDLFEADILDLDADGVAADPTFAPPAGEPARAAAEVSPPAADFGDAGDIPPPVGGSLADLMPSGPPLLGGSFMSLPPMPPQAEPPVGPGGKRRPLRVGFGGAQRPQRSSPFASDRTVADALGPAGSVDAFASPSPTVPIPPASPTTTNGTNGTGNGPVARPASPAAPHAFDDDDLDDFDAPSGGIAARADHARGTPTAVPDGVESASLDDLDDLDPAADVRPPAAPPSDEQLELLSTADRFRPRGVIRPELPGSPLATPFADVPIRIPESGVDDTADARAERAKRHRGRVNRVVGCLAGILVLGGGAAGAIYGLMPQKSTLDALITYDGLDRLGTAEAETVRVRQNDAVVNETVRQRAVQGLPPQLKDAGFLADPKQVHDAVQSDAKIRWPADRPTVMRLRVSSADKQNDVARLHALAQAIVDSAADDRRKKEDLHGRLLVDYGQLEQLNRQRSDIDDQLQALQQATATRPDPAKINALQAEYLAAEPVLTGVKGRRMELEGRIDMLKRAIAAPTTAPAAVAVDPAAADDEIAKLTARLSALQQGDAAAKQQAAEASAAARKSLDDSIARFQQDLTAAQKLRDNPVLGSYVDAANRIFKETREFTESFIRSQENLRTRVSELTSSLSDKMAARAQKLIETDPELKKLNDRLAIGTRQYNAATAEGFGDEAKKSELELRLLKVKIDEREDQYKNDPVDAEAITQLQNLKETLQTQIRDNRKYADERLTAAQDEFVKNTPAVAQLPAEQKSLAEGIEAKLTAVNDARRAYDATAEKAQADQAKAEAAAADQATALRLQIAARRQDVLAAAAARAAENDDANRRRRLESAQAELADVRTQEQTAQHRLADATAAIETAEKARRATAQSDADREAKLADRDAVERKRQDTQASITARQAELARRIVPDDRNVEYHDYDEPDRRPLLAGASFGGVFLLLGVPIVANLLALAREAHPHAPTPPPAAPARPATPGEGFEPVLLPDPSRERKALPQPASV